MPTSTDNESNNMIDYDINNLITSNINNVSGFDHLEIELRGKSAIYTRAECQLIIDNNLTIKATLGGKGIVSGLVRSFSTGTFFINKIFLKENEDITGGDKQFNNVENLQKDVNQSSTELSKNFPTEEPLTSEPLTSKPLTSSSVSTPLESSSVSTPLESSPVAEPVAEPVAAPISSGKLSIYSIIPGNIKEIVLKPNDSWCVHHSSFLACTENITVSTGLSFSTTLTGNGIFYTKIKNESEKNGIVWLTAYGGIVEKKIKEHNAFKVHSGLFLAMTESVYNNVKTTFATSIFSSIAGGQGIVMDFSETVPTENDILYLQSGNLDEFIELASSANNAATNTSSTLDFFSNFLQSSESSGGKKRKNKFTKKRRNNNKRVTKYNYK